jgi:hypothetical protein
MRPRSIAISLVMCMVLILGSGSVGAALDKATKHSAKPIVKIDVFGDSTALTLAWSLASNSLANKYGYTLQNLANSGCGVAIGPQVQFEGNVYPTHPMCHSTTPSPGAPLSSQPWMTQWQEQISKTHPNVVVLLAGRWEVVDRVYNGMWTDILNPTFAEYVKQQLELASSLATGAGANFVMMTSPCSNEPTQPNGTPYPESDPNRLQIYNGLVREVAAEYPKTDSVIDLDSLVCPGGIFSENYKGSAIRTSDGIHFTENAGIVLGSKLMPPIVASGRAQITRTGAKSSGRNSSG